MKIAAELPETALRRQKQHLQDENLKVLSCVVLVKKGEVVDPDCKNMTANKKATLLRMQPTSSVVVVVLLQNALGPATKQFKRQSQHSSQPRNTTSSIRVQ